jgi:Arc/MetJ family transcription regulator
MSTKVDLAEDVLAELLELTKLKRPTVAVQMAVREYIRFRHQQELMEMSGKVVWQEDWAANEALKPRKRNDRK